MGEECGAVRQREESVQVFGTDVRRGWHLPLSWGASDEE